MTMMSGAADGVYAELPPSLRKRLRSSRKGAVTTAAPASNDNGASGFVGLVPIAAESSITSKLVNRPLPLDNPAKVSDRSKKEQEVAKDERRKRRLAAKRRRSGRSVKGDAMYLRPGSVRKPLVRGHLRYELLEPLHRLWLGYISELLQITLRDSMSSAILMPEGLSDEVVVDQAGPTEPRINRSSKPPTKISPQHVTSHTVHQGWQAKLVKADFHGCKLSVIKAKNAALVGLSGIVAQETEGTFRLTTAKSEIKVIPKANVTYSFTLPVDTTDGGRDVTFELYGGNFAFKSADRANRKFKHHGSSALDF